MTTRLVVFDRQWERPACRRGVRPAPAAEIQHQDAQLGEAFELTFPASDPIAVFVPERSLNTHQSDNLHSPEAG